MDICITGHRPNKLYGYDLNDYRWEVLESKIADELVKNGCTRFYCGMALGVDTVGAKACIRLKKQVYDIKLIACIPFKGQDCKWPYDSRMMYHDLLQQCDEQVVVCDGGYAPYKMQVRNQYMVDHSDLVLAVWDGSDGGTANCVRYAQRENKPIINLYTV